MTTDNNQRYRLLHDLTALLPAQFEELLWRLEIPPQYLSGVQAPMSLRATELIRYMESSGRLSELQRRVAEVLRRPLTQSLPHQPASSVAEAKPRPVRCFISYADRDRGFRDELRMHLKELERSGDLTIWDTSQIYAGVSIQEAISSEINRADLVLLLVSAEFLFADDLLDLTTVALKRNRTGQCRVVPIIARPCDWQTSSIGKLQPLPRDGKALSSRSDRDAAWVDIAQGLRLVMQDIRAAQGDAASVYSAPRLQKAHDESPRSASTPAVRKRPIGEVFRTSGTPQETFVEPANFSRLRIALSTWGKGLVVEGPSGIGKSVAVKKALEGLGQQGKYRFLSAVNPQDAPAIEELLSNPLKYHHHVIIDDFHRLAAVVRSRLANLIKYLADSDETDLKLTLIGVNQAGVSLIAALPDLAGRVDRFSIGRQPDAKIEQLIEQGERAANLTFIRRADFVLASLGSFYTAQQLCLAAVAQAGIEETMAHLTPIEATPQDVIPEIRESLAAVFRVPLLHFTSIDRARTQRGACLALLWLLRQALDGCVSVQEAGYRYPMMSESFAWLSKDGLTSEMAAPQLSALLFYDAQAGLLSIEDPRLAFYLRSISFEELGRSVGLNVRISPEGQLLLNS